MVKRLTRTGNNLALILDKPLLEQAGIDESTDIEIPTDRDVIVISPVRTGKREARVRKALEEINDRYAGVVKRLAR